jgi:hypothetical protein
MAKKDDSQVFAPPRGMSGSDERDRALRQMIDKDRAATDAKTARLRALRLEQEKSESQPTSKLPKKAR